ncbi:MAG: clostripain-related cysteine peptidase, partial [Elusimicrobiota bacterium]|nr:clostripain-related cysteine peptidase [Elusimicrobiota bacterium]
GGHGTGFMDQRQGSAKGISFDDETGNYIRTKEIGRLMREAGGADILAFDSCTMQMGEVLAEIGDSARFVVGSEETVPGLGFPYFAILGRFNSGAGAEEIASLITREYEAFYRNAGLGVHISSVRTDRLPGFYAAVRNFTSLALKSEDRKALKAAKDGVFRFEIFPGDKKKITFYGDLYDFAGLLRDNLEKPDIHLAAAVENLQRYISVELVAANRGSGTDSIGNSYARAHGVALYMAPVLSNKISQAKVEGIFEVSYDEYEFAKRTGWHDLVIKMYGL